MMRVAPRMSIWEGRFEDKLSFCIADLVMLPMAVLTAKVDDLLREWGGEGPVNQYLQAAIAGEHEALVLRLVGLARAEGRSLGWLVDFLRIAEDMKPGAAVLPPAAYRAKRLGRPDPGGTWHRATLSRIFNRYGLHALLADTRQALARIVREAVLPGLYSRGLDWAAGHLNREGVPTEHQTRRELVGFGVGRGRWSRKRVKAFLVSTSPAGLQAREPAEHQTAVWQRHIARPWSDEARPADIAEALDKAALLTPAQQRDLHEGRRLPMARWTAATVRGLASRLGKHLAWSGRARDAHRAACRSRIAPLRAVGLSARTVADALNAAGVLTPSQQRARDLGRAPPGACWSCGSVLRLAA